MYVGSYSNSPHHQLWAMFLFLFQLHAGPIRFSQLQHRNQLDSFFVRMVGHLRRHGRQLMNCAADGWMNQPPSILLPLLGLCQTNGVGLECACMKCLLRQKISNGIPCSAGRCGTLRRTRPESTQSKSLRAKPHRINSTSCWWVSSDEWGDATIACVRGPKSNKQQFVPYIYSTFPKKTNHPSYHDDDNDDDNDNEDYDNGVITKSINLWLVCRYSNKQQQQYRGLSSIYQEEEEQRYTLTGIIIIILIIAVVCCSMFDHRVWWTTNMWQ